MPDTEFQVALSAEDILRVHFNKKGNRIERLTVTYTAIINGRSYSISRIDQAHGVLHKDKLFEVKHAHQKEELAIELTPELITQLMQEVRAHWKEWRIQFIKNYIGEETYAEKY